MPLYYLAFQRGPPIATSAGESFRISATIVNDLRDEVYQLDEGANDLEVRFVWLTRPDEGHWQMLASAADPLRWEGPRSAYQSVTIVVPTKAALSGVKVLRLALYVSAHHATGRPSKRPKYASNEARQDYVFDVLPDLATRVKDEVVVVSGLSPPIEIKLDKTGEELKSASIGRLLRTEGGDIVEIREEHGYELDKHIWDASLLLASHLGGLDILARRNDDAVMRIVELGAGTGTLSLLTSAMLRGCLIRSNGCEAARPIELILTDLEPALPLLETNIELIRPLLRGAEIDIQSRRLDWSEQTSIEGVDLVLVADCTYNPTYFPALCRTIKRLLAGGSPRASCLLAKKHRHADEEALWDEVKDAGLRTVLVAGNQDVEGALGSWGLWKLQEAICR